MLGVAAAFETVNTTVPPLMGDGVGTVSIVVAFSWLWRFRRPNPTLNPNPNPTPTPRPRPALPSSLSPSVWPAFVSSLLVSPSSSSVVVCVLPPCCCCCCRSSSSSSSFRWLRLLLLLLLLFQHPFLCGMGVEQNNLISLHGFRPCRLPCPFSRGGAHFVSCADLPAPHDQLPRGFYVRT